MFGITKMFVCFYSQCRGSTWFCDWLFNDGDKHIQRRAAYA